MPRKPKRVDTSGAELRQFLLELERELFAGLMTPPTPVDGRPPAVVPPELRDALAAAFGSTVQQLAAGEAVLIHRYSLPEWCPEAHEGHPCDYLWLDSDSTLRPYE
jgi:hypothetical protein